MGEVSVKPLVWEYECLDVTLWNDDRTECKSVPSSEHWSASPPHMAVDYGIIKIVDPRVKSRPGLTLSIGQKDAHYPDLDAAKSAAQSDYERRIMSALVLVNKDGGNDG